MHAQVGVPKRSWHHARLAASGTAAVAHVCSPSVLQACTPSVRPFCMDQPRPCASSNQEHASTHDDADGYCKPSISGLIVDRRQALAMLTASTGMLSNLNPRAAQASIASPAPPGFRSQVDKLDGYSFLYPERWLPVTITGNDCFFRNPSNIDENLFVDFSSPSSSEYKSVTDLGTPEQTAKQTLEQLLNKEFMSTRLGIKREGQVLSASSRQGKDGRTYYDVVIRMTSYASRNPYVATQGEVMKDYGVEWDRVLFTTLGVANNRLYEFRLQTAQKTLDTSLPLLTEISQSFTLKEIEAA